MITSFIVLAATTISLAFPVSGLNFDMNDTFRLLNVQLELLSEGVPPAYFSQLMNDPRAKVYAPPVVSTSTEPTPGIDWALIERNMLQQSSIDQGKVFISENLTAMQATQRQYGVSPYALTAVMRIETNLGSFTGRTPVFNVFLSNMANAETRWTWPKENLVALVTYCYKNNIDCLALKGSYAGAFGWSQFLPVSVQNWGVDGDGDGIINLFEPVDVIPSTANFLKEHGWKTTTASRVKALAAYYGSPVGYTVVTLNYGEALKL